MSSKQAVSKHSMTGKPPMVWGVSAHGAFRAAPGEKVARMWQAGDFILTHDNSWTSRLIRFGQRLRYMGEEARFARFNHVCMIVSEEGDMVEAIATGVVRSHISAYTPKDYVLVRISADSTDREQAAAYAKYMVGSPYGFVTILGIAWTLLTGGRFTFSMRGEHICSGLVAGALERTGAIFDRPATHCMPADLARYYDVKEG